jgi:TPR repeat protein
MIRLLVIFCNAVATIGFISIHSFVNYGRHHYFSPLYTSSGDDGPACDEDTIITLPPDISCDVRSAAQDLWGSPASLESVLMSSSDHNIIDENGSILCHQEYQGEMPLPQSIPISQRFSYFEQQAQKGHPPAQHSVGLLLWNGFASTTEQNLDANIDPEASARWHAAAAVQGNLDALAVFGGCLRTGTGVGKCKNVALGLRCIEYSASVGNPSGVNKKGAMMESNDDYFGAMKLYRECYENESKRTNALLLFNLGYCLIHGEGVDHDVEEGEKIWRDAVALAPEEGSEEAAWFLYQQYLERGDRRARHYLDIAADLGLEDAVMEIRGNS